MSEFEFVFVLYSLFLGFSLVELLQGLGNAVERKISSSNGHEQFRIGLLTPLLAIFVLLDLLSFWIFAWRIQNAIVVTPLTLTGVALFACAYFLAARLVFPSIGTSSGNLDDHYLKVRRIVLGILLALVFVQWAFLVSLTGIEFLSGNLMALGFTGLLIILMTATIYVGSKKWSAILLTLLIIRYLSIYFIG